MKGNSDKEKTKGRHIGKRLSRFIGAAPREGEARADQTARLTAWSSMAMAALTAVMAVVAGLQWIALRQANQENHNGIITLQRAFVFVQTTQWQAAKTDAGKKPGLWRVYPVWENSGNTPTEHLTVDVFCPTPDSIIDAVLNTTPGRGSRRLLGPKQQTLGGACLVPIQTLHRVQDQQTQLYLRATAHYEDVFGTPHQTEYCVQVVEVTGDIDQATDQPGISVLSASCPNNNCADEDCTR